jgi:hypothetical protein
LGDGSPEGRAHGEINRLLPIIRFTTAAGVTVTAESKTSKSSGYPIGQTISILYDPDNPNSLEIDALRSRWLVVAAAALFAVVLLGVGAAALLTPAPG